MTPPFKTASVALQFSPFSILRMCWIHWRLILGIWVICGAITVAVVYSLPAIYTAEALILVDSQKIPERYVATTVTNDIQDRLATISQEILSTSRLQKIMDDFGLYREERKTHVQEEIFKMMRDDINVKLEHGWTGGKPGAFRVGYSGKNPVVVAQVANRIASLYIEENLRTREIQAEGTSEFIQTELQAAKKKLDSMDAQIAAYRIKHTGELPEQEGALGGALNRLQMEQNSNREAIARNENTKATLENTLKLANATLAALTGEPEPPSSASQPATEAKNPEVAAPVADDPPPPVSGAPKRSAILEAQLAEMLLVLGTAHPDVKRMRAEIAATKEAEAKAPPVPVPPARTRIIAAAPQASPKPTGPNPLQVGQAKERIETLESQISLVDQEIKAREVEQERITKDIANFQGRLTSIPVREQEIAQLTRDYENFKNTYHSLLDKQTSAEMATDMERREKSERFTLLDPARVPEEPFKPNRPVLDGLGSVFGIVLALIIAISQEVRKGALLGEWELPPGVPVLARVPRIPAFRTKSKRWFRNRRRQEQVDRGFVGGDMFEETVRPQT